MRISDWSSDVCSSDLNGSLMPRNAATGRSYRGINIPILWDAADRRGYATHAWMTFRQANERGGQVRRGERGTPVVLVKRLDPKGKEPQPDEPATARPRAMLRTFTVFNVDQIDRLENDVAPDPVPEPHPERIQTP